MYAISGEYIRRQLLHLIQILGTSDDLCNQKCFVPGRRELMCKGEKEKIHLR